MKKIENSFAVTGFIGKDAEIRSFETASVARFSIASAVQTRQVKKPLMFPLSWGLKPGERMKHWIPSMY